MLQQKGKLLEFLEHELAENENMLLQMGVQKGFHKALSRYPKATQEKVLGKKKTQQEQPVLLTLVNGQALRHIPVSRSVPLFFCLFFTSNILLPVYHHDGWKSQGDDPQVPLAHQAALEFVREPPYSLPCQQTRLSNVNPADHQAHRFLPDSKLF